MTKKLQLKKIIRNQDGIIYKENEKVIFIELGDILWYLSEIASVLNMDLEEIEYAILEN